MSERDVMQYDAVIVGGGPAGLACAIKLKQRKPDLNICLLEKGSTIGAHSISGAVLEPAALDELTPEWREDPPAICVPAVRDEFLYLTRRGRVRLPTPPQQHNDGNFIISLGLLTPWLATKAEALGVDVFPGFAAAEPLFDERGAVAGVRIGDMGVARDGSQGPNYAPGPEVRAPVTFIAEGCRGSIAKQLIKRYDLARGCDPQSYGLGFKELWRVPSGRVTPGLIQHSMGWPLDSRSYGGSFIYHLDDDRVYVGMVVGLDYRDPRLFPFEVFQQFKNHPQVHELLEGGEILSAGARTVSAGGWQSTPVLEMPGAVLIGDAGGTLNFAKIKGIHQALRSGMLAANHYGDSGQLAGFDAKWRASPGGQELKRIRNIKPGFKRGLWFGLANAAFETYITRGHSPWTLHNSATYPLEKLAATQGTAQQWEDRDLPPRDRLASVFFAATTHDESQPAHLHVADTSICASRCVEEYGNPCTRFCPANVYEMIDDGAGGKKLQINAANCVHCKACDIKDPYQIINWVPPEGGSGPNYQTL
ncbi:MAG: electron transfer flavoprotein-ubiquinone oxidoreductase [Steroidobacteraceae bacterium]